MGRHSDMFSLDLLLLTLFERAEPDLGAVWIKNPNVRLCLCFDDLDQFETFARVSRVINDPVDCVNDFILHDSIRIPSSCAKDRCS